MESKSAGGNEHTVFVCLRPFPRCCSRCATFYLQKPVGAKLGGSPGLFYLYSCTSQTLQPYRARGRQAWDGEGWLRLKLLAGGLVRSQGFSLQHHTNQHSRAYSCYKLVFATSGHDDS